MFNKVEMTSNNQIVTKSTFHFNVPLKNFIKFNTSEMIVGGVPWKIWLCNRGESINAYLVCTYKEPSQAEKAIWWVDAGSILRLIKENGNAHLETHIPVRRFERGCIISTRESFSLCKTWKADLMPRNVLTFECIITSSPLYKTEELQDCKLNSQFVMENSTSSSTCPICMDLFSDQKVLATSCGHLFCSDCIRKVIETNDRCPLCNGATQSTDLRPIYLQ